MSTKHNRAIGWLYIIAAVLLLLVANISLAVFFNQANAFENAPLISPPSVTPLAESNTNVRELVTELQRKGYTVAVTHFASTDAVAVRVGGKSSLALRDVCTAARKYNVMLIGNQVVLQNGAVAEPWDTPYDPCQGTFSINWKGLEK